MRLNSLQTRMLIALALVSGITVLAVGFQGYHCGRMAVIEMMHRHVRAVAEARTTLITAWLQERSSDVRELSVLPTLIEGLDKPGVQELEPDPAVAAVLRRWLEDADHPYESLVVLDINWREIAVTDLPTELHKALLDPEMRQRLETESGVHFGAAHLHEGSDIGIHAGTRILNEQGEPAGYLIAYLNMSQNLTPLLQDRSGLMNTGKAFVFDSERNLLTEPFRDGPDMAMKEQANPFLHTCLNAEIHGVQVYGDALGHRVVGTARPLPVGGWAIGVEIDADEALDWIHVLLWRALLTGITVIGVAVLISLWLSGHLAHPLGQLAATAHSIAQGDTQARLGTMKLPEVEEVRLAFNGMLDELQAKERELINSATLATVGELTSSVVHELRNPLSSVKMNLQSLAPLAEGNPENEELAQIAIAQVHRLETMLNELLQYGRPLELSLTEAPVSVVIDEALEFCRDAVESQGIEITFEDELDGSLIYMDRELMSHALANLIRNGVEASPEGSTVRILARPAANTPGFIDIEVIDSGPGIRDEHLAHVFNPFFTTKSHGTGLGLPNVRKIVMLHRGEVFAGRAPSGGAMFIIRIPLAP